MDLSEEMQEFLIESNENLIILDREIVQLEQNPTDPKLISSVFRTIHTIKGTCGFFGLERLGAVAHTTENILSQVREKKRDLTQDLISLILEAIDEIKILIERIETTGNEGIDGSAALRERLEVAHRQCGAPVPASAPAPAPAVTVAAAPPEVLQPQVSVAAAPIPSIAAAVAQKPAAAECAPSAEPAGDDKKDSQLNDSTIRVDVKLLNKLMNLVGELVLARNQLLQDASPKNPSLYKTSQRLNLITSELQAGVMKTRMQPISGVWNKLPRVVRDLAAKCGKNVQIQMEGASTELDKTILEAIKDPLTHIVRNSCDHGIEMPDVRLRKGKPAEGLLMLRAYHEGGVVNIEIVDDGAGIDPEKLKAKAVEKELIRPDQAAHMTTREALHLIFLPGFSTAAQVTSISGRGVGMDVVKTNIEKIGGTVEVMNGPLSGTVIRIKIPLTLAIIPGLVVMLDPQPQRDDRHGRGSKGEQFVIPQANLLELVRLEGPKDLERIENVHGTPVFHHRGKLLPLAYLSRLLGRTGPPAQDEIINIVVLQAENRQMGLVVDQICDTQEIVVKPLGRQLKGLTCYMGATIMGDGHPALILDVVGLARLAGLAGQGRPQSVAASAGAGDSAQGKPQMLLLFRAGQFERLAVPLSLVARLEEIAVEKIERAGGQQVLNYRGGILPLISLSQTLEQSSQRLTVVGGMAQIIVFTDGVRQIGVIVDEILDIVKESITVKRKSPVRGLLGSAVIGGKITDLIDLHTLVKAADEDWLDQSAQDAGHERSVLLIDPSTVARQMVQEFLDVSGYHVLGVDTVQEGLTLARATPVAMVIAAVGMKAAGGHETVEALRREAALRDVPLVGLLDRADQLVQARAGGWDEHLVRSEREALLKTVSTLMRKQPRSEESKTREAA